VKTKLKILIAASFLIGIIAIISPAAAAGSSRVFLIACGDDMDLPGDNIHITRVNNIIIGKIELDEEGKPTSARVLFHQKIYGESGKKAYEMKGSTKNGELTNEQWMFYCPVCNVWFVNVWRFEGEGKFKTTKNDFPVIYRRFVPITMPNTGGKYITYKIFMWVSPTGECYDSVGDPMDPTNPPTPTGELKIWPGGGWALAGVYWDVGLPMDAGFGYGFMPVGPVSYLTWYFEK
jgi:hypothetical protein